MTNQELRATQWGSVPVEKAADILFNRRLKCCRAMSWRRTNAEHVVALRTLMLNDDWHALWAHDGIHT